MAMFRLIIQLTGSLSQFDPLRCSQAAVSPGVMSQHIYRYLQEGDATLPSNGYKTIEDPKLWTLPSCQASLGGRHRGEAGPVTCFCIRLFLFVLLILKVGLLEPSPR